MIIKKKTTLLLSGILLISAFAKAQTKLDEDIIEIESKVIEWRRDFHQYPELGNREFKTA
jgi:hypothetical protein